MRPRALVSWSSGKDSAFALHVLRERGEIDVVGLVTTFNQAADRVAMHGVRRELVEAQARAAGVPLWPVLLPSPCSNEAYEERMRSVVARAQAEGISAFAFGDLYLADIRAYRERQLDGTGLAPVFPLWGASADTPALARRMLAAGVRAILTCVDPTQLASDFVGRDLDAGLLAALPPTVDPCGERGEFHTFCWDGPAFAAPVPVARGPVSEHDGFWFADLRLGGES